MADPATVPAAASGVPRLRAVLDDVPSYVPGRPPQAADGVTPYKLASNENPYPPLPSVLDVVARAAADANRYPDMLATGLTAAIGAHDGVPQEHVVAGPGSVGVLSQVLTAAAGDGDEVVHAWRSFEAYPIVVRLSGATPVPVPLTADGRHDMPALAAAVTERTRLVVVCSPNNPTGPVVTAAEMDELLAAVPSDVLVVLDEAYREFVRPGAGAPDAVALHLAHPNLVVLRTFSKAYGLAGLRVGYGLAHPAVADALRKTAIPFGVSTLAQAAAVASLEAEDELLERVAAIVAERERVAAALAEQGWPVPRSEANFVWMPVGQRTAELAAACAEVGLSVRAFAEDGVRVTVAEPAANDRFLEVAAAFRRP
ncbi:histidinol-phosphate transaminase [Pseudokineococcus lusitanus]|uniref:Aromatic amino acid aminotransferase n=1 Tax=Pseudokineococcus lusitanus TaxID=763993 RepID=A0A3N1HQM3_9ACTN|nr:histidinol-phosphate transaminase [Pseudokineococcus lusitanus]ROP44807.1 histidinol-phosphate aminotransferase [Pseudokineococcus lusitanus]